MQTKKDIFWPVFLFLVFNPLVAIVGTVLCYMYDLISLPLLIFSALFALATNMSITAGYHRLFSHRSYEANPWIESLFLFVGASAFQGSCLKWSSDHRQHHKEVDTEEDPYSINKGFWYAHMGWLFWKESVDRPIEKVQDLQKNPRVMLQHNHYIKIAILSGFIFPMLVGGLLGSAIAGLILAGSMRIFLTQQSTFLVNSLCHYWGKQTYSKSVTARDSFIVAVLTHGEGYHNFHHTFQLDYRNGIRWYHWDPTKWLIMALHSMGLVDKLKTISPSEILKMRLQMEAQRMKLSGFSHEKIENLKLRILSAQNHWKKTKEDYILLKRQAQEAGRARILQMQLELKLAKLEFRSALKQWKIHLKAIPQLSA